MKLKELNCVLRLYATNFRNLHWNSKGENFDNAHKEISTEYYEMLDGTVDQTAEMMARLGENAVNYEEVMKIISDSEKDYLLIDSNTMYTRTDIIKFSDTMLNDVCRLIEAILADPLIQNNPVNVGIKSTLEGIHEEYDLQTRYINKRRMDA